MNDTTLPLNLGKKVARRKVGVKKGFGLHDWMKLKQVTKDLAQRKGQPLRKITAEEVSLHSTEHDGWVILRDKVYNLTPYLHYHPGGLAVLKASLGKDCTEDFDVYHRWVNIDGLIGNLLLGFLDNTRHGDQTKPLVDDEIFPVPAPRPKQT